MSERKSVPLRNIKGEQIVIQDPMSLTAVPQYTQVPYEIGDLIELTNADFYLRNGLAIAVNPDGIPIHKVAPLKIDDRESRSGRKFFLAYAEKHDNNSIKVDEALQLDRQKLLDSLSQHALLSVANKIDGSMRRQQFLDRELDFFLNSVQEILRVSLLSLIDDKTADVERRIPRNTEI